MAKKQQQALKSTIEGMIEGAFSEISSLADEMREAYDNTPESLQNSDVGTRRGEAADTLENYVDAPEVPECVSNIEVEFMPLTKKRPSRAARRDQATYELGVAISAIESFIDAHEEKIAAKEQEQQALDNEPMTVEVRKERHDALQAEIDELEEQRDAASECKDEVETAQSDVDGVDFPGMYG